jgi:hypothetical protein
MIYVDYNYRPDKIATCFVKALRNESREKKNARKRKDQINP